MDRPELARLLRRAQRREPEALAALVEGYGRRVFGLLYRLTGSREAAEDLLQETFLRMVRTIDTYEHDGRFEAWLFRIAANLARDEARRRGRRGGTVSLEAAGEAGLLRTDGGSDSVESRLAGREEERRLQECLGRLPPADREILLLRFFSEMPFREIAELLGVPLGTALARAHRALARLREEFGIEVER